MSVDKVQGAQTQYTASQKHAAHHAHDGYRKALADAEVGDQVTLRIVGKLADRRFLAAFGDRRYVVDSTVSLSVGQTVKATVSALGGVVELKYLGGGDFQTVSPPTTDTESPATTDTESREEPSGAALTELTQRYRVSLTGDQRQLIASLSDDVREPKNMALGALYMTKLGATVDETSARALYSRVVWDESNSRNGLAQDVSALIRGVQGGDATALQSLSQTLADAIDKSPASTAGSTSAQTLGLANGALAQFAQQHFAANDDAGHSEPDQRTLQELAARLLNTQDNGALAYRYGSLPVMIGGQLVELDLLMFRERDSSRASSGLKKLVMTLRTETLGPIEIVAQSLDTKLSVAITAQSSQATELLSSHAREVKDLVTRLGWNVDSVSYRLASEPARAAGQLVQHVLASGSLDAML
ncbi:MAG TPA: flagellar hook-length control protein FliK [Steroidobacteraceae bacterium]|nr:flagellar hook-length control protein FliK [Steroidobacteraceae bacterium]